MTIKKKNNKFKPLYKKFLSFRENIQNRKKLFKFKKEKWLVFSTFCKNKLKRYKRFKLQNQTIYVVSKRPDRYSAYTNRYKRSLKSIGKLRLFIGNVRKKSLTRLVKKVQASHSDNKKQFFIESLERRLDVVLFRAKFCQSLRNAQQYISHGKVMVNNRLIEVPSYLANPGDIISLTRQSVKLTELNIKQASIWPIPPKHLIINYKTLQIVLGDIQNINTSVLFLYGLELERILAKHV